MALPLAGGFVAWLLATLGLTLLSRRAHDLLRQGRHDRTAAWIALAAVALLIGVLHIPSRPALAERTFSRNHPIGTARGIYPGRVVWVHDPQATDWEGTNLNGEDIGDGYWWQAEHTDQDVADSMLSRAIRGISGEPTDATAWTAIFRHFNQRRGNGDIDYQPGEKITIKINLTTVNRMHANVDGEGNQLEWLGWVNTSPQMILALLRQLVYTMGVAESDITVGDPTADFPNHYWIHCHAEFPSVRYMAWQGAWDRHQATSSEGQPCKTPVFWSTPDAAGTLQDYLPVSYAEADYLINLACLKGHSAGITLCAKNHYGSLIRLPIDTGYYDLHQSLPNAAWTPGTDHYRALVDIMGHSHLGDKTVLHLVDGLYGGYWWQGRPSKWTTPPFGNAGDDWPSSLFASLDQVAIDSVGYDFLLAEWPDIVTGGTGAAGSLEGGEEDYLHEASRADAPDSGTFYDPDGDGSGLSSLGVHEHWNNNVDKQYSRNLATGEGIELLAVDARHDGDFNADGVVSVTDLPPLEECLAGPGNTPTPSEPPTPSECLATYDFDFDDDLDLRDFLAFQLAHTGG